MHAARARPVPGTFGARECLLPAQSSRCAAGRGLCRSLPADWFSPAQPRFPGALASTRRFRPDGPELCAGARGPALAERVVVVATEAADSPWANRLPSTVPFIEFGKLYAHLAHIDQKRLLARLLLQMSPQVVHNINSWLGYQVFATNGQALGQASQLYCHVFCGDITVEGKTFGLSYHDLPACFEFLTGVFGDNQTALDHLCRVYGFDAPGCSPITSPSTWARRWPIAAGSREKNP